ncbi:hypothetical protein C9925_00855 [cyanobacterium G8-9]|nr:hypothetical protein C9925_00855 [cyanobacterium G8-9]
MIKNSILFFIISLTLLLARDIPSDSKIQGRLNIVNGASAECVMHQFYTKSGWVQVEGEIGRNGIDGLYYKKKNGVIKDVLVAESKWNTSRLGRSGKNKAVKQMSQEWVLRTMNKLIRKMPSDTYTTLKRFIENNQYRARLFRLKPKSNNTIQISIYKIKNKGLKAFDEIKERELPPIVITAPKNSFEKRIVEAYNSCRATQLHKYLSVLNDSEVAYLLTDNYIQKKDVKQILR